MTRRRPPAPPPVAVKPAPFSYRDPETLDEALDLLAEFGDEASVLAGGQSLVPLLNLRLARPRLVVDINRLPGLDGIEVTDGIARLGALARATAVERDDRVRLAVPLLSDALRHVGHPQIRNRTTIGGSLAHADPASELPAVLAALDGSVTLASRSGSRTLSSGEFFQGVFTTARRPDELVVSAELPRATGLESAFLEVARRPGDFALVGACVCLRHEDGAVAEARIALLGVAGTPVRLTSAEEVLEGRSLDDECLRELRGLVREELEAFDDVHASAEYRRAAGAALVARAARALRQGGAA